MAAQNAAGFSIRLFGSMQVEAQGESLADNLAKKERWQLALLALRPGQAVTREYLAGLLWPDNEEELALYYLRRSLSNLRTALGTEGDRLEVIKPRSLRLQQEGAFVDVREFDRLLAGTGENAQEQALALYRGPLLEDCLEDWAFQERVQREVACQQVLSTLTETALTRSDWINAVRYSRLHIAADPLHEQAYRGLMQAQACLGNHAAASQVYRDLRVRLREEINADPDLETTALYEAIRQEARQNAVPRPHIPLSPSPQTKGLPFPQPFTRLIGREQEQTEVRAYLATSRLVTLVAAGGVGKTRFAIEVVRSLLEAFAEGTAFVELAPVTTPERVPRTVAQDLGIPEEADMPLPLTLSRALQNQERLLVLDNCEHLSDACAALTHTLLLACPRMLFAGPPSGAETGQQTAYGERSGNAGFPAGRAW